MFTRTFQNGPERARHQKQPDKQTDEQEPLPEPAEIDVFETLMAEPMVHRETEFLLDAENLSGHRAADDDQQADEKKIHAEPLELRLVSRHGGRDEQTGGKPRGCDPENSKLRVPGASDGIGEPFAQRNSIKTIPFNSVMRSDGAKLEDALKNANVPVERREYEGVTHEFFGTAAVVAKAREAQAYAGQRLKAAFGS